MPSSPSSHLEIGPEGLFLPAFGTAIDPPAATPRAILSHAEAGAVAIVLAYALGKAQEAALVLTEAGIPTVLHGAAWKLLPEYEAAGFAFYSGLTDDEIRRMGVRFRKITVARYGPVRAVAPEVVLEVAFDTIQKSSRHKSGFALRFPRIVRIRDDKRPEEADTVERVEQIWKGIQGIGGS